MDKNPETTLTPPYAMTGEGKLQADPKVVKQEQAPLPQKIKRRSFLTGLRNIALTLLGGEVVGSAGVFGQQRRADAQAVEAAKKTAAVPKPEAYAPQTAPTPKDTPPQAIDKP